MKKIWLLIFAIMMVLSLSACRIGDGGDGDSSNNGGSSGGDSAGSGSNGSSGGGASDGDTSGDTAGGFKFAEGRQYYIVLTDGNIGANDVSPLVSYIAAETGKRPTVTTELGDYEYAVIFGESDNSASRKAYRLLERTYKGIDEECAYVIYEDGGSIGIAYDSIYSAAVALEKLKSSYTSLRCGANCAESLTVLSYLDSEREALRGEFLDKVEVAYGEEIRKSFENMYSLYGFGQVTWRANLWDPVTGGFYYSNSGRDTVGYLPDLESTKQMISWMTSCGMMDGISNGETDDSAKFKKLLNEEYPEFVEKIVRFAQGLQDPEDGYFYHPQWGKAITASRKGRDFNWALTLIELGDEKPLYDAPGVEGYYPNSGSGDVSAVSSGVVGRLGTSRAIAVSKAVSVAASSSLPDYLKSLSKLEAYLDSLKINEQSYTAGNELAAQSPFIEAAGEEYMTFVANYIISRQKSNGLWEDKITYGSTNGLMKLNATISNFGYDLPNADKAAESIMIMLLDTAGKPEGGDHTCDKYNLWYTLRDMLNDDRTLAPKIEKKFMALLPEMLNATYYMSAKFIKNDGSISYYRESTAGSSQGANVAVPGTNEGDVNASGLGGQGLMNGIAGVLRHFGSVPNKVPLYSTAEFRYFMDIIYALAPVEKLGTQEIVIESFDDYEFNPSNLTYGVDINPSDNVSVTVRDKEIVGGKYKWVSSAVTDSPAPRHKDDKALYFAPLIAPCTCGLATDECICKRSATYGSNVLVAVQKDMNALVTSKWVAEFKLYVCDIGNDVVVQFGFAESSAGGSSCSFNVQLNGTAGERYVKIYDNLAGLDGMKNSSLATGLPVEDWIDIKIELYKTQQFVKDPKTGKESSYQCNVTQMYINGEYVGESDSASIKSSTGLTDNKMVNYLSIYGLRGAGGAFYIDDAVAYSTEGEYKCLENPGESVLENFAFDKEQTVADFENGKTATYYLKNLVGTSGTVKYEVVKKDGDSALHITTNGEAKAKNSTKINLSESTEGGACYVFESKMLFNTAAMPSDGEIHTVSFGYASGSSPAAAFYITKSGNKVKIRNDYNYTGGSTTVTSRSFLEDIDGNELVLPGNKWFTFKMEYYHTHDAATAAYKIYVGDADGNNMKCVSEGLCYKSIKDGELNSLTLGHYQYRASDLYIDDVSFTMTDKKFKTDIPNPLLWDFEFGYTSGSGTLSDTMEGEDKAELTLDPKDKDNTVMKLVDATAEANASGLMLNYMGSQITNGITTLSTRLYIESAEVGEIAKIALAGTSGDVVLLSLVMGEDGEAYILLPAYDGNTDNTLTDAKISVGAWHEINLVFDNSMNAADAALTVYIDGENAGGFDGFDTAISANITTNVHYLAYSFGEGKSVVYIDDLSLIESYVPKAPTGGIGAGELTTVTPGESFDSLTDDKLIGDGSDSKISFGQGDMYIVEKGQNDDTVIVTDDPTGADNKVLMFTDGSTAGYSSIRTTGTTASVSSNPEKYSIAVFESKVYFTDNGYRGVFAQLRFRSGKTSREGIDFKAADGYVTISGVSAAKFDYGTWYVLRVEYHNASEGKTLEPYMEIFINGTSVGTLDGAKYQDVNNVYWQGYSSARSTVYLDNMSYTERLADYPEQPEPTPEPEPEPEPDIPETEIAAPEVTVTPEVILGNLAEDAWL